MHDQRVVCRSPFGLEDLRHGRIVVGICRQTVHRFRWQAQQAASPYAI
jgi:hypothetical protein